MRVVVLDGEQAMLKKAGTLPRVSVDVTTMPAGTAIAFRWSSFDEWGNAAPALTGRCSTGYFVQVTAFRAHQHVLGVSGVVGQQVSWEQAKLTPTLGAVEHLDPQEVFHRDLAVPV
jgi:hypothetical protein